MTKELLMRKFRLVIASALVALATVAGAAAASADHDGTTPRTQGMASIWWYRP